MILLVPSRHPAEFFRREKGLMWIIDFGDIDPGIAVALQKFDHRYVLVHVAGGQVKDLGAREIGLEPCEAGGADIAGVDVGPEAVVSQFFVVHKPLQLRAADNPPNQIATLNAFKCFSSLF